MHEDGVIDKKRSGNCNCFLFPAVGQFPPITACRSIVKTIMLEQVGKSCRCAPPAQVFRVRKQPEKQAKLLISFKKGPPTFMNADVERRASNRMNGPRNAHGLSDCSRPRRADYRQTHPERAWRYFRRGRLKHSL